MELKPLIPGVVELTVGVPDVVGFKLHGRLPEGATATDLVLMVTQMLRKKGVVGRFVEFYGTGLSSLTLPDRATIANMAPEYGATMGFFPVDAETLAYLRFTGRTPERGVGTASAVVRHRKIADRCILLSRSIYVEGVGSKRCILKAGVDRAAAETQKRASRRVRAVTEQLRADLKTAGRHCSGRA